MTLEERQKRERERLLSELEEIIQEREGCNAERVEESLNLLMEDPKKYFKILDKEE